VSPSPKQTQRGLVAGALLVLASGGCSLLVDTGGLAGSAASGVADGGGPDGTPLDGAADTGASSDAPDDVASDAPTTIADVYAASVLSDGPAMYLRLDDSGGSLAVDSASGGTSRAYFGKVTFGVPGAFAGSSAIALDGTSGGIDAGPVFDFDGVKPFTLEAWLRSTKTDDTYRFIFSKDVQDSMNRRQEYAIFLQTPDGFAFERYVNNNSAAASTMNPAPNSGFHHVVSTYDGARGFFWIDGNVAGTFDDVRSAAKKSTDFYVGAHDPGYGTLFGALDDVAVYEKALTSDRILAHYHAAGR
jgi:hypothetical protein